ncbi:TlpA disulfide reductase family protein [Jiulongibacter sediminis]|uniref:TlpA family protein disulfide reductase n=1 Tax=Jiulongibacter sediminis TaxID=1605367 RepID=UPI0026EAC94B|nr:TlpA disulfide reductase family protein [Jiulongibacter sediminis]
MTKQNFSIFLKGLLTFFLFNTLNTSLASEPFRANEKDPYLLSSFSYEKELENLLAVPSQSKFAEDFETEFGENFDTGTQYEALKTTNVDEWEMKLFEQRNKQMEFFKSYKDFNSFSEEFIDLVTSNINYNYWHLLLAYSINRSNDNTAQIIVTSLPAIMTEPIDPSKINNDKRLISKSYREFLPYFVIYFNSKENSFKKYTDGVKSITDKAEFAEKYLSGEVFDYTMTRLLEKNHQMLSTSAFRIWASHIYCENLQRYLTDNYFDKVAEAEASRADQKKQISENKNKSSLPNIMDLADESFTFEKYKGKVVYVDFWASWCGPCRQEFPYSKAMHEGLTAKQKKEIVFLYISIDQDLEKWRAAVEKLGLKDFGENGHSFEVSGRYQVKSIPRYMIINKNGEIVDMNAPRPSSPETLPKLLELL